MCILSSRHMVDEKAIKLFYQFNCRLMVGYQVFIADLIFSPDLINNELGGSVRFKVLDSYFLRKLNSDEESIVFCDIIGAWLCKQKCTRKNVVL